MIQNLVNNSTYLITYVLSCGLVTSLYYILYPFLNNSNDFKNINPAHKKWYVISNLIKGYGLALITLPTLYILYNIYLFDTWNTHAVKTLGLIYSTFDTVSLYMVPKMQKNTIIHHYTVVILYLLCLTEDFAFDSLSRLIVIYGIWSSVAFSVNLFLAYRVLYPNHIHLPKLREYALYIYILCCSFNWTYQFYYLFKFPLSIFTVFYSFLLYNIIFDDIVLINYLYNPKKKIKIQSIKTIENMIEKLNIMLKDIQTPRNKWNIIKDKLQQTKLLLTSVKNKIL